MENKMKSHYKLIKTPPPPSFGRFVKRSFGLDIFKGLFITLRELFRPKTIVTVEYPLEKLPLSPRYRAVHSIMRLLESGESRCIGCGLCEKICVSNCIKIEASYSGASGANVGGRGVDSGGGCGANGANLGGEGCGGGAKSGVGKNSGTIFGGRKIVESYSINLGRCIYCGLCAEVCPELAIVHGARYENAAEQRAGFVLKDDLLTPIDSALRGESCEFSGFGSVSMEADKNVKQTPLGY